MITINTTAQVAARVGCEAASLPAVDDMTVKLSSLVGGSPELNLQEPLTINFKKVSAAETMQALWDKVSPIATLQS